MSRQRNAQAVRIQRISRSRKAERAAVRGWLEPLDDRRLLTATVELVKDINPYAPPDSSNPQQLTAVGNTLFFVAEDQTHGQELWKTDGTEAGTLLVKDICPGVNGSSPSNFTRIGSVLYFSANDGTNGIELWKSDGTTAGTLMVKNISPTSNSSPNSLVNYGGQLLFSADDGSHGRELWKSNGTEAGTTLLTEIEAGSVGSYPSELVNFNGKIFFTADDDVANYALWQTDGTAGGTSRVLDVGQAVSPGYLTVSGTKLFFSAAGNGTGQELWVSDGTPAGTSMVKDIYSGPSSSQLDDLTDVNGTLFFSADNGENGPELWKSDGTPAGTVMVKNIVPEETVGNTTTIYGSWPARLTNNNGTLYFIARNKNYQQGLWKSDGSEAGTVLVKDGLGYAPTALGVYNANVYFTIFGDVGGGTQVWKTNGTPSGNALVTTLGHGQTQTSEFVVMNNKLYFPGRDTRRGAELFRSDGTTAGTTVVKDINVRPGITDGSEPSSLVSINGSVYFTADDGDHGGELWKSNGTCAGTSMVADIFAGTEYAVSEMTVCGNAIFFEAYDGQHGWELWKSDGTAAGTMMVKDINPQGSSSPMQLTPRGNTLFFFANSDQLWQSDGTSAGTVMVKDINPNSASEYPRELTVVGSTLFFIADDGTNGNQLWTSDGTEAGTAMVKNIDPAPQSFNNYEFAAMGATLFFTMSDGVTGKELWKSDGTADGTARVADINPAGDSSPASLTPVGTTLFFTADDGSSGTELWKTDGTEAGTQRVQDINPSGSSSPTWLTAVGDTLFFAADDGTHGTQLWKSDGSSAGTVAVTNLLPDDGGLYPTGLLNNAGTLYFSGYGPQGGRDPWKSDGTTQGTQMLREIDPGGRNSVSFEFNPTMVGQALYFTADDGVHGSELWRYGEPVPIIKTAKICGAVYHDVDGDCVLDKGEGALGKQTVFLDSNNNGKYDAGEPKAVTDTLGRYTFASLPAGTQHVHILTPSGYRMTTPTLATYDLTLTDGQIVTAKNFLFTQKALVSGTVFFDANKNKKKDAAEAGLKGWQVFVDTNKDGVRNSGESSILTDSLGNFSFKLSPGTYVVRVVAKKGYKGTTPAGNALTITVKVGQVVTGKLFGQGK